MRGDHRDHFNFAAPLSKQSEKQACSLSLMRETRILSAVIVIFSRLAISLRASRWDWFS
jgi:hypothetical protein